MGTLYYGSWEFAFDDRLLAHLQVLIAAKLRRQESFFLSWRAAPDVGDGRHSIWVDNGIQIYCEFAGSRMPAVNRTWLDQLARSANSASGLQITDEPG